MQPTPPEGNVVSQGARGDGEERAHPWMEPTTPAGLAAPTWPPNHGPPIPRLPPYPRKDHMDDNELINRILAYAGLSAQVRHWRVAKEHMPGRNKTLNYYSPKALRERGYHFSERGGLTVVRLTARRSQFGIPTGELLTRGVARCSMTDVFDRKYGHRLALLRAVRQLEFPALVLDHLDAMKNDPAPSVREFIPEPLDPRFSG